MSNWWLVSKVVVEGSVEVARKFVGPTEQVVLVPDWRRVPGPAAEWVRAPVPVGVLAAVGGPEPVGFVGAAAGLALVGAVERVGPALAVAGGGLEAVVGSPRESVGLAAWLTPGAEPHSQGEKLPGQC